MFTKLYDLKHKKKPFGNGFLYKESLVIFPSLPEFPAEQLHLVLV